MPGSNLFPDERGRGEVAVMRYVQDQIGSDSVPVPFVLRWGVEGKLRWVLGGLYLWSLWSMLLLFDLLNGSGDLGDEHRGLDTDIDEGRLEGLYGEVKRRPLSQAMNELVRLGASPREKLPRETTTFESATEYSENLAELHIAHLIHQRNDAIDSADDCRRKLVARHLFRKLTRERRLMKKWSSFDKDPFKLWCDDFSPANILMDEEEKIVGTLDWEFTYAAPQRLQTFWRVMRSQEYDAIEQGWLKTEQRLSEAMRDSWKSGNFWISYAARNSFAFDLIYWRKIDQRFFGDISCPAEDVWRHRLDLLESGERAEKENIAIRKVEEMNNRELVWDPDDYTREPVEKGFGDDAGDSDEAEAEGDDGDVDSDMNRLLFVW
ncbi:uncharacterized protein BDV14DRAFT_190481 [Aspergillus stella-maris]|uniref:uncharacterized protein n=1 Tax=Aspergillus stella-maris TaxID=1810926 RepID=UPI003CCD4214